jgi:hypothetical protein
MARKSNIPTKTCTKTGEVLPATAEFFYRDKSQKDGLSPWSKAAERAYNKAYREGLKNADAPKKAEIKDAKGAKAFETAMTPERVVRGTHKANRSATPKVVEAKAVKATPAKSTKATPAKATTPRKRTRSSAKA